MQAKIGHVHLQVSDAGRSERFYGRVLGLRTSESLGPFRFLTGGAAHHELALQTHARSGLYHVAFEVEDDRALTEIASRLEAAGVPYTAVDHGISRALYFDDPDGLGVEVYVDRRSHPEGRPDWNGRSALLRLPEAPPPGENAP